MMCISFFTTRIVLEKLGVSDYGLYNVVGGFVSMFSVLNSILQTSTNRFLALSIGKGDQLVLKRTFSTAIAIHLIIVLIVFILKSASNLNGNLNCSKELEHYAS